MKNPNRSFFQSSKQRSPPPLSNLDQFKVYLKDMNVTGKTEFEIVFQGELGGGGDSRGLALLMKNS